MVTADGKPLTCVQDFKNVCNGKDVDCDEITIEFQLRSLPLDAEAHVPTQNVQYPRQIEFEESDLYTDDPEDNTSGKLPEEEQLGVTSEEDDHRMRLLRYNLAVAQTETHRILIRREDKLYIKYYIYRAMSNVVRNRLNFKLRQILCFLRVSEIQV